MGPTLLAWRARIFIVTLLGLLIWHVLHGHSPWWAAATASLSGLAISLVFGQAGRFAEQIMVRAIMRQELAKQQMQSSDV